MPATLVVARGPSFFLLGPGRAPPVEYPADAPGLPRALAPSDGSLVPPALRTALAAASAAEGLAAFPADLARRLAEQLGTDVRSASAAEWRSSLARLPPWDPAARREYALALARATVDRAFRSPEEVLVSLAREEERFERAVLREDRAFEAFVSPSSTALALQAREWGALRDRLHEHHRHLLDRLETSARSVVPNLAAVVGPRVSARLVAAAGGVAALARVSGSRLQLLGARRRPSPERGPRYGLLYRAECLATVPEERRAAFARSVAALAVIAARADATTRTDLSAVLLERRDRRAERLRRARR